MQGREPLRYPTRGEGGQSEALSSGKAHRSKEDASTPPTEPSKLYGGSSVHSLRGVDGAAEAPVLSLPKNEAMPPPTKK